MHLVALGDSLSCGEGVGVRVPPAQCWPVLLAGALPDGECTSLATPGARIREVAAAQVAAALAVRPDVVTVLVGLNDVIRAGFVASRVQADLVAAVAALRAEVPTVLVCRLHDPTELLPLPRPLAAAVRTRVAAVNAAVDEVGGPVLDLARVAALRRPAAWAVDRVHPAAAGQAAVAAAAGRVLAGAGTAVSPLPEPLVGRRAPGLAARGAWTVRHGLPWLALRSRSVALPVLGLAVSAGPGAVLRRGSSPTPS